MTRDDIASIRPGDSIIGFNGSSTEYEIVGAAPFRNDLQGKARRLLTVRTSPRCEMRGSVVEGDPEILCKQRDGANGHRSCQYAGLK